MSLKVSMDDLPNCEVVSPAHLQNEDVSSLQTKLAYGTQLSIRHAVRAAGYHSRPHAHDTEQLNYVISGELSIFMNNQEYRLEAGDFMHVPRMVVHWAWNRGLEKSVMVESHCPPNIGNPEVRQTGYGLFSNQETVNYGFPVSETLWLSDEYAAHELDMRQADDSDVWIGRADRVIPSLHTQMKEAGPLYSRFVYGFQSNLMVATRAAGYHSKPHIHKCEQLNLLLGGRLWIFTDREAHLLQPGDFMRVPAMAPHWAWNDGDEECLLIEAHSPVLDPGSKSDSVALLPTERGQEVQIVQNLFLPASVADNEAALKTKAEESAS